MLRNNKKPMLICRWIFGRNSEAKQRNVQPVSVAAFSAF